mmetsp:Transcript_25956/g.28861  ORF Transcript_25956/g.28861 Transcript_25956/m.28861 type:complete len:250 (+) Transcript_25956:63-812(+)
MDGHTKVDDGTKKKKGRRKIEIAFIEEKSRRHITFSKRKAGIMKKAYELATLTGTQVLLLVASETGHVYTFATPKLQPLITKPEGKNLIQACLNAPDAPAVNPVGTGMPSAADNSLARQMPSPAQSRGSVPLGSNYQQHAAGDDLYTPPIEGTRQGGARVKTESKDVKPSHLPHPNMLPAMPRGQGLQYPRMPGIAPFPGQAPGYPSYPPGQGMPPAFLGSQGGMMFAQNGAAPAYKNEVHSAFQSSKH